MASPDEIQAPPVGEEIHLPGPSAMPFLMSLGITIALVGVTFSIVLVIVGSVAFLATLFVWLRDSRREFNSLPPGPH